MHLIDTHCHLTHEKLRDDIPGILERAAAVGVQQCITIGTNINDGIDCLGLHERYPHQIYCSIGLDPFACHESGDDFPEQVKLLSALISTGGYVAVGEIGMDYHYDLNPPALQREQFEAQCFVAETYTIPVIIHVREAHEDMLACLATRPKTHGVIHSFTGSVAEAERYLALGWMLSFNGITTFKNAPEVAAAAAMCPLDMLLVETDSPYLAPVPMRGKCCEPAYTVHTLQFIADLRGMDVEELAAHSTANAQRLFAMRDRV